MKLIADRISDRHILGWINQWLRAPVVEEDQEGKRRTQPSKRGMSQGGVISSLLANIYLHLFDRVFLSYGRARGVKAHLVRYADDFVILMRGGMEATADEVRELTSRKTHCVAQQVVLERVNR